MKMNIAIVHDYLITYGGAERVLEALHEIWPAAPVYTAWVDWEWVRKNKPEWLKWEIHTSWFDKLPFKKQLCSPLRFVTPWIWKDVGRRIAREHYDVVISSSAWYMAKGVALENSKPQILNSKQISNSNFQNLKEKHKLEIGRRPIHICYCHTPPRYLYGYDTSKAKSWLVKLYGFIVNPLMRYYDFQSSQAVDRFIANSEEVKRRIWKFYRKEATIVYPPVNKLKAKSLKLKARNEDYYLVVNRLVVSKNTNIAIEACMKLGVKLKVVGEGPQKKNLELRIKNYELDMNRPGLIELLGYVDEERLAKLYQNCKAVIYLPQDEDFGIVPVEAMAYGRPVIAVNGGGVKETVIDGKTGILIDEPKVALVMEAMKKLDRLSDDFGIHPGGADKRHPRGGWPLSAENFRGGLSADCRKQAEKFGKERFKEEIQKIVIGCYS